jgi:hypothetical protein
MSDTQKKWGVFERIPCLNKEPNRVIAGPYFSPEVALFNRDRLFGEDPNYYVAEYLKGVR